MPDERSGVFRLTISTIHGVLHMFLMIQVVAQWHAGKRSLPQSPMVTGFVVEGVFLMSEGGENQAAPVPDYALSVSHSLYTSFIWSLKATHNI
jgi:hypothetical protein